MTRDVAKARIANATTEPEEHEEIEVTPEMIAAGECAFAAYDHRFDFREDAVRNIWLAMERARKRVRNLMP